MDQAILYILYNVYHRAIKIGISDISGRRFAKHKQKGWVLVTYWHFFERDKARELESLILNILRKKYGIYLDKKDMPQGGYTETFDSRKISRKALIRLVNKNIKSIRDRP